jgi:hypothetical protein
MKPKYRFLGSWFLFLSAFVLLFLPLLLGGFVLNLLIEFPHSQTIEKIAILSFCLIGFILLFMVSGKNHFQWVLMDQEELVARCLWKVLVRKKWTDIRGVKIVRFPISVRGGFSSRWFIFEDGTPDTDWHNYILDEKRPIMIKCTKRSSRIIKQLWNGQIIEETTISR